MDFDPIDSTFDDGDLEDSTAFAQHEEGEEKDITKDGGVKKLIVKEGEGWDKPETGDDVNVHYTGTLLDGTKFDSSLDRNQPFNFKLGQGQVIKGWDKGVATMKKGEKAVFTISSDYAYGKQGSPPTIPPDSTLKFEVELLSWTSVKDICGDGGIFKKILVEGKKWESPKENDEVRVKYEAKLSDGTVFSKSPEEGVEYYVGDGVLCPAVSRALKSMHKGEVVTLTVRPQYAFGESGRKGEDGFPSVPPNETISIDLELLSWKTVENVTEDGKVVKKILKEGDGYERPNDGAHVKVRYTAKLPDGTIFEKKGYEEGQEFEFVTDEEKVVEGLDKAVLKMKKGEIALVTIAPEYAYKGESHEGEGGVIVPPNTEIQMEVEVFSFVKVKDSWELDNAEKLVYASKGKEEGNALYKEGKYSRASKKYTKACKLIDYDSQFGDEEKKQSKALQLACNLNNAACKLKLKDFNEAIKLTFKVLESQPLNVKALFRRAQGYMGTQDYDLAEWDIKKILEIDPENRDAKQEFRVLKVKVAEQNKKEAKIYGNMFSRMSKLEEKETKTSKTTPANGHEKVEENGEPMVVEEAKA